VLNADDPLVWAMRQRTRARTWAFSVQAEPVTDRAVWASRVTGDELGRYRFTLHAKDAGSRAQTRVALRLSGRHHVPNAVAAAAAAVAVGVDLEVISARLSSAELRSGSRMELHQRPDGAVVINDAYNANPESARAAVDTLAEIGRARGARGGPAHTWAVLGDMLELGATAPDEHAALGRHLAEAGVDHLVAVGDFAADLARGAAAGGLSSEDVVVLERKATAAQHVLEHLQPGDTVLVKASRGLALDTVAEEIWTSAATRPAGHAPGRPPSPDDPPTPADPPNKDNGDREDPA